MIRGKQIEKWQKFKKLKNLILLLEQENALYVIGGKNSMLQPSNDTKLIHESTDKANI